MNGTTTTRPEIFDRIGTLGDPTRARLLLLLQGRELSVSELCAITQAPQSTVSRHLKALADGGWVDSRREGTVRWYSLDRDALDDAMRRLWSVVREEVAATAVAAQDAERLPAILRDRRARSREFFSSEAGQWDRVRDELFGERFALGALPALFDPTWTVGDLGCGTGALAATVAPWVRSVVALDDSPAMLAEARRRLASFENVDVREADLETLPLEDGALDAATMVLVLHHVPDPERVLREAARVVRPGGRLLVVDMLPHDRDDLARPMGHVWMGFEPAAVAAWLDASGFETVRPMHLPVDARARGPALFAVAATRRTSSQATETTLAPDGATRRNDA
jgi:ArsR family transcriptional regulator